MEAGVFCAGYEVMDSMTEFVEESHYFIVFEERRFSLRWFGEVAHEGCRGVATRPIGKQKAWLEGEVGCVTIFSFAGMEIKVEVPNEASTFPFIIPNAENLNILIPGYIVGFPSFYKLANGSW